MIEPLYEEIDRLARDAAAEAPDVDLSRLRGRAARRRSARLTGLATAGVVLVAGTGFVLSQLDGAPAFDPATPAPVPAHPACGERHHAFFRSVLLPVEVGSAEGDLRVAVEATDSPTVTTWIRATEASAFSDEATDSVRAVIDAEGPSLVIADHEGTVVGYARLAKAPGARDLHPGESLEYEGYEPFRRCPGADDPGGGPMSAGTYSLLVDGSWTLPDGERASLSRAVGTLHVTSRDATNSSAHPACGERRSPGMTLELRQVEVGTAGDQHHIATDAAAPPPVTTRITFNDFGLQQGTSAAPSAVTLVGGGLSIVVADGSGVVVGYSWPPEPSGPLEVPEGESLELSGYAPIVRCPGVAGDPESPYLSPGAYALHVEGAWLSPDGTPSSGHRPGGLLLVTSGDTEPPSVAIGTQDLCTWEGAKELTSSMLTLEASFGSSGTVGEPVRRPLTLRNEFDVPVRIPAGHGPFLLVVTEHGREVLGYASLAEPPGTVTIDAHRLVSYAEFGPVVACPGAPTAPDGVHLAAGRYLHHAAVSTGLDNHLGTGRFDTVEPLTWLDLTEP